MADNDLSLGRIVEYLTHQPEWKNMAIFVTQDDSGDDSDHVDRHRSYVLCISPYAKRGYVSNDHTSIMSILKTPFGMLRRRPLWTINAAAAVGYLAPAIVGLMLYGLATRQGEVFRVYAKRQPT